MRDEAAGGLTSATPGYRTLVTESVPPPAQVEPTADPGDASLPPVAEDTEHAGDADEPFSDPEVDPESNAVEPFAPDDPEAV